MTLADDEPLDGSLFGPDQPCFGCSPTHPHGLHLTFERVEGGVRTCFTPGEQHQGPVGVMHGGLVMTLADEVAAWAIIAGTGKFGFTTDVQCRFHQPVRIGRELSAVAQLVKQTRRLMTSEVEVRQGEALCFTGTFRFAIMDRAGAERMMGIEMPEAWARFGR
ncbi:MAG: PaaI family thioesterase [Myxococcales bacterium]|nr:PaaI family thioesterase [Myxococcales bacterium]MCB9649635.1 PaaI family thioesterase [Deltaproteobacteria bacterium]